jgi:DNA replication protein DnaC
MFEGFNNFSDEREGGWQSLGYGNKFIREMREMLERASQMEYEPGILDGSVIGPRTYNAPEYYRTALPSELITARMRYAKFPQGLAGAEFANFRTPTQFHESVVDSVEKWVSGFGRRLGSPRSSLLMFGGCGLGKTHLAVSAAKEIILQYDFPCLFADCVSLMSELRGSFSDDGLEEYTKRNLLIIDDLGAEQGTNAQTEKLIVILRKRMNECLPTIITTNLSFPRGHKDQTGKYVPGAIDYLSERTTSRMEECFDVILFANMKDYRHNIRLIEERKFMS